ncbi:MAG: MFS transporter [Hyphomonadaceae bacterium]
MTATENTADRSTPAGFAAWWMVAVLFVLNILSMLDRLILTMLVGPIKADLLISDFQMSLILGPAFAVFYALFGVPIGWAVDRYSRRLIIFCGVTLWALSTVASGFARSYETLLFFRICVGIGEAALAPAAVSLIADAFPKDRVTTALSVFQSAAKIGAAFAMAAGGLAIAFAGVVMAEHGSLFEFSQPWHLVMAMVGAPGIVIALLVFTFREPARTAVKKASALSTGDLLAFLRQRWQLWVGMFVAFNCISILGFALSGWMPTYFDRQFGWTPVQYGPGLSLTNIASAVSLVINGWIIDRLYRRGMRDIHLRFYTWLIIAISPAFLLIFYIQDPALVLICYALIQFVTVPFFVFVSAVIVMVAPGQARGQLAALYFASFTVLGQGVGPTLVGAITDYGFGDEAMLGRSLAIVTLTGIAIAFAALQFSLRHVGAAIKDAEAETREVGGAGGAETPATA